MGEVSLSLSPADVSVIRVALRDKARGKRRISERQDVHGLFGIENSNLREAKDLERIGDYLRSAVLRNMRDEPDI